MTKEEFYAAQFFGTALELRLFFGGIILGAALGALYDVLRALRMTVRHSRLAVAFEDFGFVFVTGIAFYSYCTQLCRGQIRFFVLTAIVLGFAAYLWTLGRIVSRGVAFAVNIAKMPFQALAKMLKKLLSILFVVPFFQKDEVKFEENPCPGEQADV